MKSTVVFGCVLVANSAMSLLLGGCASHYVVRPLNPADRSAEGLRYYLPVPYVLVTNMNVAETPPAAGSKGEDKPGAASASKTDATGVQGEMVSAKLIYLPDMSMPYGISVKGGGVGVFKGAVQLLNGWMLTGMNQESDAKLVETVSALSALVGTAAKMGVAAPAAASAMPATPVRHQPFLYLFKIDTASRDVIGLKAVDVSTMDDALRKALSSDKEIR